MGIGDHGNKIGRPTNFTQYLGDAIAEMICEGISERKICKILKIHHSCISRWKHMFPEFKEQIVRARDERMVRKVERSQFKTAVGYKYTEVTREISPEPHPETGEAQYVVTKKVTKHVKPSTSAQQFILTNLKKERWKRIEYRDSKISMGLIDPKKSRAERVREFDAEAEIVEPKQIEGGNEDDTED